MQVREASLGREVGRAELDGFVVREIAHEPGRVLPAHAHAHAALGVVLSGGFTETLGSLTFEAGAWDAVVRPAGAVHSDRIRHSGCRVLVVEVRPDALRRLRALAGILTRLGVFGGAAVAASASRLYAEFKSGDALSEVALPGLCLELLAEVGRRERGAAPSREPLWMAQARAIAGEELAGKLGLSAIARRVGVHPVHLARAFRERHGTTWGAYVRRLRVEEASRRLVETDRPLAEIASVAGFSDPSHFGRLFRRHTGMTPSQFRKAHRGG